MFKNKMAATIICLCTEFDFTEYSMIIITLILKDCKKASFLAVVVSLDTNSVQP